MTDRDAWATPEPKPLSAPPAVPQIERQLLGAVLSKPALYEALADVVRVQHFSEDAYGRLWALIASMNERGVAPSMELLLEPAEAEIGWERKDIAKLLAGLVAGAGGAVSAHQYALSLRDVWMRRELWQASLLIQERARRGDLESSGGAILEEIEARLYSLGEATDTEERAQTIGQALNEGLRQAHEAAEARDAGRLVGAPTGLSPIDKKLGGLRPEDLIVVGSRPGMGKTAFALKIARSAAEYFIAAAGTERPKWVAFFSLEMGADQLALRWSSAAAMVDYSRIRNGEIGSEEMMRLNESAKYLQDLPIWIDDSAAITVPAIRMRARRLKRRKGGLGLIVIDYLQLVGITREQRSETQGNRVQEISLITRGLKRLAKDMGAPVLALCQLSREVEKREDKRPQLSDLRESGSIEQDSDLVGFLYREAYYLQRRPPQKKERETEVDYMVRRSDWTSALERVKDTAEFLLEKNRHGATGTMALKFMPEFMLFSDDSTGDASPDAHEERLRQMRLDLQSID